MVTSIEMTDKPAGTHRRLAFTRRWILCVAAVGLLILSGCEQPQPSQAEGTTPESSVETPEAIGEVTLTIQSPEAEALEWKVPCTKDAVLLDVMKTAQQTTDFRFRYRGEEDSVFITEIQGIKNKGSQGKNWVYMVNEQLGDCSAGIQPVAPGDQLSWHFGKPDFSLKKLDAEN